MLSKLEAYIGCVCVPSNTTKKMPAYPYVSFSMINNSEHGGTYAETTIERDGVEVAVRVMPILQTWSFTVQSDKEAEALEKAMLINDFFQEAKIQELADNDIIVAKVGAITPRDNLITIEYEYRKGLDITLRLNNVIDNPTDETIENITLASNAGDINLEKE